MKTITLLVVWSLIYLAFTFERPGVGQGPSFMSALMAWIPLFLVGAIYVYRNTSLRALWKPFVFNGWKVVAMCCIIATPLLDLLFKYTPLVSPILPGTFTSAGLMGVTMLAVWYKFPTMSFKVFAIGVLAAFLMMYISELEYLTRFTIHFWQEPVNSYNTWIEFRRVPLVLIPCVFMFAKLKIMPTKWTWIFAGVTLVLLGVVWHSQYFLMYWDGSMWAANDLNEPIYILNRVCKLGYMAIVLSLDYSRSVKHETVHDNQPLQYV